ncbi:hypothetical protein B0T13DRAFT_450181 [Neurospora crassa]|nr:hypothetical protein B0T13DRAFT_450181 [Neurospora crassa]
MYSKSFSSLRFHVPRLSLRDSTFIPATNGQQPTDIPRGFNFQNYAMNSIGQGAESGVVPGAALGEMDAVIADRLFLHLVDGHLGSVAMDGPSPIPRQDGS